MRHSPRSKSWSLLCACPQMRAAQRFIWGAVLIVVALLSPANPPMAVAGSWETSSSINVLEENREVIDAKLVDWIGRDKRTDDCPDYYVLPSRWREQEFVLSDCIEFSETVDLPISTSGCPNSSTKKEARFNAGTTYGVWRLHHYPGGGGLCVWLTPEATLDDGVPYRADGIVSLYVAVPLKLEGVGMRLRQLRPAMEPDQPFYNPRWLVESRESPRHRERWPDVTHSAPYFGSLRPDRLSEKATEDDAPATSAPADRSAPISKSEPPAEPDSGAAPGPGKAPARTAPPSGKVASDRPDDASQICTVDGKVITSAGQDLISRLQAKYVAVLKPNQAEKIDRFATISNEYYDDATIDNPFVNAPEGERQHVVEVRSLKSYDKLKRRTGEVRAAHIGEVILPENRAAKTERPVEIRLRIIATRLSLNLLAPRKLAALIARDYVKRIRFQITYDQIIGPGALAEPRQFSNFEDLASQVTNDPLSLSEQQTGELFELIAQQLKSTSSKYDHVVIAKENWAAPISTAESLLEITKGENANWLSVYSTPTAAHGNSYIRAAMDRTSAGRFYSAAPARGENAIPASRTFVESLYSTAETRSLREGLTTSASEEPRTILVDLYDIIETPGEDTGHVVDAGQMGQFIKKLEQLSRMIQDKLNGTRLAANGISLDHFHRKSSPPFLIVPTSADLSFMRADSLALMTKKSVESMGENINYLMETRAFKVRSLQCDAYFVSDKRLGFAQSLGAGE